MNLNETELDVLAGLILKMNHYDRGPAIEDWKRLLKNGGWDGEEAGRAEWAAMAARGLRFCRSVGIGDSK